MQYPNSMVEWGGVSHAVLLEIGAEKVVVGLEAAGSGVVTQVVYGWLNGENCHARASSVVSKTFFEESLEK